MESQIYLIASLALIDGRLDEFREEFGDLPKEIEEKQEKADEFKALVEETEGVLNDIREFCSTSKKTLVELKEKEKQLSKQQFKVRNNKEFDAITKEISHIKSEHSRLSDKMRTEGIKEENLLRILEKQKTDFEQADAILKEKQQEFEELSDTQNEETTALESKRKEIVEKLEEDFYNEYMRIRKYHSEAAVQVRRDSCSGCFSHVPPQKIVEIRTKVDTMYFCENCGRILYPEEATIDESVLELV